MVTHLVPHLLTVNEVADVLRISRPTAYRLIERGELPAHRVGGQIRVDAREMFERLGIDGGGIRGRSD